jgi:hypothetical protein
MKGKWSKRKEKRAEKIIAMTAAEVEAEVEKMDPLPPIKGKAKKAVKVDDDLEAAISLRVNLDEIIKRAPDGPVKDGIIARMAALDWLRTTARNRGPNAVHARIIEDMMRSEIEQGYDDARFVELFRRVRGIDINAMMFLITGP